MKLSELKRRGSDGFGAGHFGAPRGSRTHKGVDLLAQSGEAINSPVTGTVTKVGYPYGDDLSYRYVQITAGDYDFRVFYVEPSVRVGQEVTTETAIGSARIWAGAIRVSRIMSILKSRATGIIWTPRLP